MVIERVPRFGCAESLLARDPFDFIG